MDDWSDGIDNGLVRLETIVEDQHNQHKEGRKPPSTVDETCRGIAIAFCGGVVLEDNAKHDCLVKPL